MYLVLLVKHLPDHPQGHTKCARVLAYTVMNDTLLSSQLLRANRVLLLLLLLLLSYLRNVCPRAQGIECTHLSFISFV